MMRCTLQVLLQIQMAMTEADYDRWMDAAYFDMLSDFVVASLYQSQYCTRSC